MMFGALSSPSTYVQLTSFLLIIDIISLSIFIKPFIAEKNIQRQLLPKVYFPYGVIYLCKTSILKKQKTFYPKRIMPYRVERWQNYEVDDKFDLLCVEAILKNLKNK